MDSRELHRLSEKGSSLMSSFLAEREEEHMFDQEHLLEEKHWLKEKILLGEEMNLYQGL